MDNIKREEIKAVHDVCRNDELISKLREVKEYINNDLPEWQQLIMIGGFVAEIIKTLKWTDKPKFRAANRFESTEMWRYHDQNVMTCEDICESIVSAIDYELASPIADELNDMLRDWEFGDSGKYKDISTHTEMSDLIMARLEKDYPGMESLLRKYFFPEE